MRVFPMAGILRANREDMEEKFGKKKVEPSEIFLQKLEGVKHHAEHEDYVPSGINEDLIRAFGSGEYQIIVVLDANKCGKTSTAANILKNIIWPNDKEWFSQPLFEKWPFPKQGRLIGTVKNTADDGPIRTEILKWWPRGKYTASKGAKHYFSLYECDTGWKFDVMTYEQATEEFEGPLLGVILMDEPAPERILGACMSRFMHGGILLITATPYGQNIQPLLQAVKDMEEKGLKVKYLSHTIYENSETTGKLNSKGTKRGLMSDKEIEAFSSGIPIHERPARLEGKMVSTSGLIYPAFDENIHVKDYDLSSPLLKEWNCFMGMDPVEKYYPFFGWWGRDADNTWICYNEWPTYKMMGAFYDEIRRSEICPYTPEDLSGVVKVFDGAQRGMRLLGRAVDPRFARGSEGDWSKKVDGIVAEYSLHGLNFQMAPFEKIGVQRERIRALQHYEPLLEIGPFNRPRFYILPHCQNTIRAFKRHYWEDENAKESERYKDPIDVFRYILATFGDIPHLPLLDRTEKQDRRRLSNTEEIYAGVHSTALA